MSHCTRDGGKPVKYDLPYSPPKGPVQSPAGSNHGNAPGQGRH